MRRGIALLAALGLVLALPTSASAGRATRETDSNVNLYCDGIQPVTGTAFAYFGASVSALYGPGAFLDLWNAAEPSGPPDLSRDYEQPVDVSWDGTTLAGSFPLADADGDPAGQASFSATLTPVGDPYVIDDSFKDGNQKYRATGQGQALQPEGSLVLSTGQTFDLANCYGDSSTISVFATNPNSFVSRFAARTVDCPLTNSAGDEGFLFVDLSDDSAFVDSAVFPVDGSPAIGAYGEAPVAGGVVDGSLDTYVWDTGESAGVDASIHMTIVETGEKFDQVLKNSVARRVVRGTLLDLAGTLTIGTYAFDLDACVGADYRAKVIQTNPRGPKPGGKVPGNDLPSGAKLLAVGGSDTVQTKGASPDAEAPYECLRFEDFDGSTFEVPVANTVWYKVKGTGAPVTIDTAGSDFDTVAAVYTADGAGGFTPVPDGCVDDVPTVPFGRTLQAAVTIPTTAETTYYVQIGGFPDTPFPFGVLRVAVR